MDGMPLRGVQTASPHAATSLPQGCQFGENGKRHRRGIRRFRDEAHLKGAFDDTSFRAPIPFAIGSRGPRALPLRHDPCSRQGRRRISSSSFIEVLRGSTVGRARDTIVPLAGLWYWYQAAGRKGEADKDVG